MDKYLGKFEWIDPRLIVIDTSYQRGKKNMVIDHIAQNFSWEAFGVPTCFRRANGQLYAADGQQRIAGVMAMADRPKEVPVLVFPIEGVESEAAVFVQINEWRKALLPIEKHRGKVRALDPAALGVERALDKAGYHIGTGSYSHAEDPRRITAIAAVNGIYNRIGEEGLVQTLVCIREAWPDDGDAIANHILKGVALVIEEQGEHYNRAKLTTALRRTTPGKLLRKAEELHYKAGGSKGRNIRLAMKDLCGLQFPRDEAAKPAAAAKK